MPDREGTRYVTYKHYLLAAAEALGADARSVAAVVDRGLAESALAAPAAGFGDHEEYPAFEVKCAVLLQRVASNHALPDGNKRTALLCAILFANLNGLKWEPRPATAMTVTRLPRSSRLQRAEASRCPP